MKHLTREIVADIINNRPSASFDTHWIEQRILRLHPVAFAEELLEFRTAADPLMAFSSNFSKWVGNTFSNEIRKSSNGKVLSVHLGGDECGNQEWTKLNPGTPII